VFILINKQGEEDVFYIFYENDKTEVRTQTFFCNLKNADGQMFKGIG
jgi:hypothetical protein